MQAACNVEGVSNIHRTVEDKNLKRSRKSTDENQTEAYSLQGRKKIKVMAGRILTKFLRWRKPVETSPKCINEDYVLEL